ncbi:phosphoenolpyruvate carboxykinase (ATP) [Flavihumibacter sp. R14]|nr:phosphoenolpyruvate carboxykinase (ATP) [Flavihumibacter soli]
MSKTSRKVLDLKYLNLHQVKSVNYQLEPAELIERAIINSEGTLTDNGALAVDTGEFTGRSPKDRFIVADSITEDAVWWGDINIKFDAAKFDALYNKVIQYLSNRQIYVHDAYACADPEYMMSIRVITESAFQGLFANNMFLRYGQAEAPDQPEWTIIAAPGFKADPLIDGTRQGNFAILNFTRKVILIGGTGYTGEIKKGIFSVLNFLMPHQRQVLSMHCSANVGNDGDTAIFFGLSGTGKTTLSADPQRRLIGDDEHGWSDSSVFNFEGGCYAKCVDLTPEREPQIYNAIRFGALLENTNYFEGSRKVDFSDIRKTENTRVAYPIHYIDNAIEPSIAGIPKNIFFLTADAFGVLPPISRLTPGQTMYHFISGYTAKVAGTEAGITEPQTTFSACFGKAFLPLHPTRYAELLGRKMKEHSVNVWLINTGWTGGPYGIGSRMKLSYTRSMISAALNGELDTVEYKEHPVFGLMMPVSCPDVPSEVLDPRNTWKDKQEYDRKSADLAQAFVKNFNQFAHYASDEILRAAPKIAVSA